MKAMTGGAGTAGTGPGRGLDSETRSIGACGGRSAPGPTPTCK